MIEEVLEMWEETDGFQNITKQGTSVASTQSKGKRNEKPKTIKNETLIKIEETGEGSNIQRNQRNRFGLEEFGERMTINPDASDKGYEDIFEEEEEEEQDDYDQDDDKEQD